MKQFTIDDYDIRLVPKNYMSTLQWYVYDILKLHLTKDNAIKAICLANMFEIDTRQIREIVTVIRSKQNAKIIGDNNGYYIGTEEEFNEWIKARIKRTMSSIKTTLDLTPNAKNIFYWLLNEYNKQNIEKGQSQLQFNGWEQEFIRQYAEEYMEEEK